jgi:hypothetical protein
MLAAVRLYGCPDRMVAELYGVRNGEDMERLFTGDSEGPIDSLRVESGQKTLRWLVTHTDATTSAHLLAVLAAPVGCRAEHRRRTGPGHYLYETDGPSREPAPAGFRGPGPRAGMVLPPGLLTPQVHRWSGLSTGWPSPPLVPARTLLRLREPTGHVVRGR